MKGKRVPALVLAAVLLITATVFVTLAYLNAKVGPVKNTFTLGQVAITLDEEKVDDAGQILNTEGTVWEKGQEKAARVMKNTYHLSPGHEYVKDPTVHVDADCDPAYLMVKIEVKDATDLEAALTNHSLNTDLTNYVTGYDAANWDKKVTMNGTTKEIRLYYKNAATQNEIAGGTGDIVVFDGFKIPEAFENADIKALDTFEIDVTAYAVQADGFTDAETAVQTAFPGE